MKVLLKKQGYGKMILQPGTMPRDTKRLKILCGTQLVQNARKNMEKTML